MPRSHSDFNSELMHSLIMESTPVQLPRHGRITGYAVRWKRGLMCLATAAMVCLATPHSAGTDAPALSGTQVKALFLFNFTKYVDWPSQAFTSPTAPLVIGLVGNPDLTEPLRTLVAGKTMNGRRIEIRSVTAAADSRTRCHILFLGDVQPKHLPELLQPLRGQPVLLVGEDEKFTRLGGIVNFGLRDNKVRIEINTAAAAESGLKLGSKLLAVADLVQYKP